MLLPMLLALQAAFPQDPGAIADCPVDRAVYRAAAAGQVTARLEKDGKDAAGPVTLTISDARLDRVYRFALTPEAKRLGLKMQFLGASGRGGATSRYRPGDFALDRAFFLSRDLVVAGAERQDAAPSYIYPAHFFGDLYYAGAAEPDKERGFIPPGLFVLAGCEGREATG